MKAVALKKTENEFVKLVQSEFIPFFESEAKRVAELIISDKVQYDNAIKEGAALKKKVRELDEKRKEFLEPFLILTKTVNGFVKGASAGVEPAIDTLLARASKWQREENDRLEFERKRIERERQERERKLEEARQEEMKRLSDEENEAKERAAIFGLQPDLADIKAQEEDVFEGVLQHQKTIDIDHAVEMKQVEQATPKNVRKNWKYRIVDVSKIPANFMIPDEKAIGGAVRGGARLIEGIEIYFEEQVILR